jgi:hypothetical protein
MPTPDEYRQLAQECLQWARTAETHAQRKTYLDMARTWAETAAKLTNGQGAPPPDGDPDPLSRTTASPSFRPVTSPGRERPDPGVYRGKAREGFT